MSKELKLGILYDETQRFSPSNKNAIHNFIESAKRNEIKAEIISKYDLHRLPDYQGIFIRDTTAIKHYTHAFALFAEALEIPCIDDVKSIIACTNKATMYTKLNKAKIAIPFTLYKSQYNIHDLDFFDKNKPIVVKELDSCFSKGVHKINTCDEFVDLVFHVEHRLKKKLLLQEYIPTEFDWRIGVLANKAIFACKYYMSKDDWRIVKYDRNEEYFEGDHETFQVEDVDPQIIGLAERAASLFGQSLYGVDIKIVANKPIVIEVNDNPSIDGGVEDQILEEKLYDIIIKRLISLMK